MHRSLALGDNRALRMRCRDQSSKGDDNSRRRHCLESAPTTVAKSTLSVHCVQTSTDNKGVVIFVKEENLAKFCQIRIFIIALKESVGL